MKNIIAFLVILCISSPAWSISFTGDSNTQEQIKNTPKSNNNNNNIVKINSLDKTNKIIVQYFFSYSCKECYNWFQEIKKVRNELDKKKVIFQLQPIIYENDPYSEISTQIYFSLMETNQLSLQDKIWEGLYNNDWTLKSLKSLQKYMNTIGGNGDKLLNAIQNSPTVDNLTLLTPQYTKRFKVKWPPVIIVSGRYGFSKAQVEDTKEIPKLLETAINNSVRDIRKEYISSQQ